MKAKPAIWPARRVRRIFYARLAVSASAALGAYVALGIGLLLSRLTSWDALQGLLKYGNILPWYLATAFMFATAYWKGQAAAEALVDRWLLEFDDDALVPIRPWAIQRASNQTLPWIALGGSREKVWHTLHSSIVRDIGNGRTPLFERDALRNIPVPLGFLLLVGPAGNGKSRMATELCRDLCQRERLNGPGGRSLRRLETARRLIWFLRRREHDPWDSGRIHDAGKLKDWKPARPTILWWDDPAPGACLSLLRSLAASKTGWRHAVRIIIVNQCIPLDIMMEDAADLPIPMLCPIQLLADPFEQSVLTKVMDRMPRVAGGGQPDLQELSRLCEGNPLLLELAVELLAEGNSIETISRAEVVEWHVNRVFRALESVGIDDRNMSAQQALACGSLARPDCARGPVNAMFSHALPGSSHMARIFPAAMGRDLARIIPAVEPTIIGDAFLRRVVNKSDPESAASRIVAAGWQADPDAMVRALVRLGAEQGVLGDAIRASLPAQAADADLRERIVLALVEATSRLRLDTLKAIDLLESLLDTSGGTSREEFTRLIALAERLCAEPDTRGAPILLLGAMLARAEFLSQPHADAVDRAFDALEGFMRVSVPATRRDCWMPPDHMDRLEAFLLPIYSEIANALADPSRSDAAALILFGRIDGSAIWLEADEGSGQRVGRIINLGQLEAHIVGEVGQLLHALKHLEPKPELIRQARNSPHIELRRLHAGLAFTYEVHRRADTPAFKYVLSKMISAADVQAALHEFGDDLRWARGCAGGLAQTAHIDRHDKKICAIPAAEIDRLVHRFDYDYVLQERRATIWRINAYARQTDPTACATAVAFVESIAAKVPDRRVLRYERAHAWRCLAYGLSAIGSPATRLVAETVEALCEGFRGDRALTMERMSAWMACARAEFSGEQRQDEPTIGLPRLANVPDNLLKRRTEIGREVLDPTKHVHALAISYPNDLRAQVFVAAAFDLQAAIIMTRQSYPEAPASALLDQASAIVAGWPDDSEMQLISGNIAANRTRLGPDLESSMQHLETTRKIVAGLQTRTLQEERNTIDILTAALCGAARHARHDLDRCRSLVEELKSLTATDPTFPNFVSRLKEANYYLMDAQEGTRPTLAETDEPLAEKASP